MVKLKGRKKEKGEMMIQKGRERRAKRSDERGSKVKGEGREYGSRERAGEGEIIQKK